MKKFVLFALFGILAASCSIDDHTVMDNQLVGVWKYAPEYVTSPLNTAPVAPTYIRFDGSSVFSSDTNPNPGENAKGYLVTFDSECKTYILDIVGDKKYSIALPVNDLLDLSYVVTPADATTKTPAVIQSTPYIRVATN